MTVYIDQLKEYPRRPHGHLLWCHMFADTTAELHAMAKRLGLRASWFQGQDPRLEFQHYDVTESKRREARRLGAVEMSTRQYIHRAYARRKNVEIDKYNRSG